MEEKLLDIINIVLQNRSKSVINSIQPEMNLRDTIGFDSMDLAEITARVEAEFDIDIFEDGMVYTIGDIIEKIKNR